MVFGLFRNGRNAEQVTQPVQLPPPVPFTSKMLEWLDNLSWEVKRNSGILSASAYSKLREIDSIFRSIQMSIQNYPAKAEHEYIIESTLTNYIPSALTLFKQLPAIEQRQGDKADSLLLSQCEAICMNINKLKNDLQNEIMKDLSIHTKFVEERFKHQI